MSKSAEKQKAIESLESFGIGQTDANIYLKALELGPSSVQEIAEATKQNRVTAHSAIERLREKGILKETRRKTRRLIMAADPEILRKLVERKQFELSQMSSGMDQVIEYLQKQQKTDRYFPTVTFYEGVQGFQLMLEETLKAKEEVLVLNYVPVFEKIVGREFLADNILKRAKKQIATKLIFPKCEFANILNDKKWKYNVEVRLTPEEKKWNAALFLWNETVALVSFKEERLTTTFIENKDIAVMMRLMHELIWNSLPTF